MDFAAAIDAARKENANGIEMRRGKKYTTVAIRVEMARRYFGAIGILTEIVHLGMAKGEPVIVRSTIYAEDGRALATGTAEEIRGQGNVNTTSALENAETSAIGRALAALGLSGGEFASANEMDKTDRRDQTPPPEPPPPFDAAAARDRIKAAIGKARTLPELAETWKHEADAIMAVKDAAPPMFAELAAAKDARKAALTGNDPARQAPAADEHMYQ